MPTRKACRQKMKQLYHTFPKKFVKSSVFNATLLQFSLEVKWVSDFDVLLSTVGCCFLIIGEKSDYLLTGVRFNLHGI